MNRMGMIKCDRTKRVILLTWFFILCCASAPGAEDTFRQVDWYSTTGKEIKKLNRQVTLNEVGVKLFQYPFSTVQFGVGREVSQDEFDIYRLYAIVTDYDWNRIIYLDQAQFEFIKEFGSTGSGNGQFLHPMGLDIDEGEHVFVADSDNDRIVKLDFANDQMTFERNIEAGFDRPTDVAWHNGGSYFNSADDYLMVADCRNNRIVKTSINGAFLGAYGTQGSGVGQFWSPSAIATDREGVHSRDIIYVADNGNNRIVALLHDGAAFFWWREYILDRASDITSLEVEIGDGAIYATDKANHRIIKFSSYLEYLTEYGTFGHDYDAEGVFFFPTCMSHWKFRYEDVNHITQMAPLVDLFTAEKWTDDSGGQRHRIGVDVLIDNLQINENNVIVSYRQTSAAYLTLQVINNANGAVARTLFPGYYTGSQSTYIGWDGRDDSGNLMSGRFYFRFHLESPYTWEGGSSYFTKNVESARFDWTPNPNLVLHFTESASSYGIQDPTALFSKHRACFADIDNDGDLDLFLANWYGISNRLFRNDINTDSGTFTDITAQSGLATVNKYSTYACFGDYDNDGFVDLFVANRAGMNDGNGYDILYHNEGNGTFSDVTATMGVRGPAGEETIAAAWADFDNDGDLDLAVAGSGELEYVRFFANLDGQLFSSEYGGYVTGNNYEKIFDLEIAKFNDDPMTSKERLAPDIFILRRHCDNVFINNFGCANNDLGNANWDVWYFACQNENANSMDISIGDYDFDGDQDLYITNEGVTESGYVVQKSDNFYIGERGSGTYENIAASIGVDNTGYTLSEGNALADFDNDGDLDIYTVQWSDYNKLYQLGDAGLYTDVAGTANVRFYENAYEGYFCIGDVNNDGAMDIFLPGCTSPNALYLNDGNDYNYINIKLVGTTSNRDGLGAAIKISYKELGVTPVERWSWLYGKGGSLIPVHFGLGACSVIDTIAISWPFGTKQYLYDVPSNQTLTVAEHEPSLSLSKLEYIDARRLLYVCPGGDVTATPKPEVYLSELSVIVRIIDEAGAPIADYPCDKVQFQLKSRKAFSLYSCDGNALGCRSWSTSNENGELRYSYKYLGAATDSLIVNCYVNGEKLRDSLVYWATSTDLKANGVADLSDVAIFGMSYNLNLGQSGFNDFCDYNRDGKVRLTDFAWFGTHYPDPNHPEWKHYCH